MVDNGGQQVHAIPNPYSSSMRSMNTSTTYSIGTSGTTSTQVVRKMKGRELKVDGMKLSLGGRWLGSLSITVISNWSGVVGILFLFDTLQKCLYSCGVEIMK